MISKNLIKEYYIKYNTQYLTELFDNPIRSFNKIDNWKYTVNSDGISAEFIFHIRYDLENLPNRVDKTDIKKFYEISWNFTGDSRRDAKAWVSVTATSLLIINDFIRTMNPDVIVFSSLQDAHVKKIYLHQNFLDKLKIIFSENYKIFSDDILICIVKQSKYIDESIRKYSRTYGKSISESRQYSFLKKKMIRQRSTLWEHLKIQMKRIILKKIYLNGSDKKI